MAAREDITAADDTIDERLRELTTSLDCGKLISSELKWAILSSAVRSYRRESLLKPFPPMLKTFAGEKDFIRLEKLVSSMPQLSDVDLNSLTEEQKHLLYWALSTKEFDLKHVSNRTEKFDVLKSLSGDTGNAPRPNYLFEVCYCENLEEKFQRSVGDRTLLHAFHGSSFPNFYSILHHGLIANMNKTSAFGEGTYLSNELSVSLNWSPLSTPGCVNVSLGNRLGCVAFCEIINDPKGVRCGVDRADSPSVSTSSSVPEKYIVVQNDGLVRVKYLLLYVERKTTRQRMTFGSRIGRWASQHRFWMVLAAYCLLLMLIGLANSKDFHSYIKRFSHYWLTDYHRPTYDDR